MDFAANHEEFGLVFASEESAHEFHRAILARLLASTFSQVMACPCSIDEHKRLAGKWVSVEPDAVVQLVQSADGRQAKVLLFKAADFAKVLSSETGGSQEKQDDAEAEAEGDAEDAGAAYQRKTSGASEEEDAFERPSGEGDSTPPREAPPSQKTLPIPLFYFEVSVGEYITPLPELNQMQWWGAALDEPGAQKRLYRICFGQEGQTASEKKKASEKFLGKFGLVFADVCANKRLAAEDGGESVVDPSDFFDARASEGHLRQTENLAGKTWLGNPRLVGLEGNSEEPPVAVQLPRKAETAGPSRLKRTTEIHRKTKRGCLSFRETLPSESLTHALGADL